MSYIIIVHGTPGSGKSTHSKALEGTSFRDRPIFHISIGEIIRNIMSGKSESVFSVKLNTLGPDESLEDEIVNGIVFENIAKLPDDSYIIVDGYPTKPEALKIFYDSVESEGHTLLGALHLNISEQTSFERLAGRGLRGGERVSSITPEYVDTRYKVYQEMTIPTLKLLEDKYPVINVSAEHNNIDRVREEFNRAFYTLADTAK